MKIASAGLLAISITLSAWQTAYAESTDSRSADRAALLKVFHEIEAGINEQNVDRMVAQMTPDATVIWLSADVSRGREDIRAYYNRTLKGPDRVLDKYTTKATLAVKARFYGDVAIADGAMQDMFFPASREPFELSSKWTATCVKTDGQWKVASLHLSTSAFKNTLLDEAENSAKLAAVGGLIGGVLLVGMFCWWRMRRSRK